MSKGEQTKDTAESVTDAEAANTNSVRLTRQQQKALHLGCKQIAETLNLHGKDMRVVLKPEIDIPWTTSSVKEYLFKPVMKAMTSKTSTTELEKQGEIDEVWEVVIKFLMEHHHIEYVPFPSHELNYWERAPLQKDVEE